MYDPALKVLKSSVITTCCCFLPRIYQISVNTSHQHLAHTSDINACRRLMSSMDLLNRQTMEKQTQGGQ